MDLGKVFEGIIRGIGIFFITIFTSLMSMCRAGDYFEYKSNVENAATNMLQCVINQDKEGLYEYLNDVIKEHYSSDALDEIERLFEDIDGNITSYDYEGEGGGQQTTEYGEMIFCSTHPGFEITTDTGKEYLIEFSYIYVWNEKPEGEGLNMIFLVEDGDWDKAIRYMTDVYDASKEYLYED